MAISNLLYRIYERRLTRELVGDAALPRHIGVMVDGNRRWARDMGYTDPNDGHRAGAKHIERFLGWCDELGVAHVTIYMLSTENLERPADELDPLLDIICDLAVELAGDDQPWRVGMVGALDLLPTEHQKRLKHAQQRAAGKQGIQVNLAICYGGQREIADAVRSYMLEQAATGASLEQVAESIDAEGIAGHLYTAGQPDPDLVIRTSGEQRLSGFLLWQSAYSEYFFCDSNWPDFRRVDFLRAVRSFATRDRRFGK
ncbi:isoprenyl transferase [Glycomyces buryatensis]|uniref:Isoprenyl transferase n=1 Tax=Glycomyces buryatensis TaxID=2570927 RepID=A0A4S8QFD1_9ACTN|nr:isoprenyl transferase [Glycomyces buryatensis]THV42381.1 isoprenyl transferase [Glycomyces buryatensis]